MNFSNPRPVHSAAAVLLVVAVSAHAQSAAPLASGIDRSTADPSVRIQDDAFRAVEGKWLASAQIRPDRSSANSFQRIFDETQPQLRGLIESAATTPTSDPAAAADAKKIGDLYASFMDEARVESLGTAPIRRTLARIDAARTKGDVAALFGAFDRLGVDVPFGGNVHQDAKDSSRYVFDLYQGGIGVPDRDYLLVADDAKFADVRAKYEAYLANVLSMIGDRAAAADAKAVLALETAIAKVQWTKVETRDPVKRYNVFAVADLPKLAPHFDWKRFLDATGVAGKVDSVVVSQPTYVQALDPIVVDTSLATWKAYLKTRLLQAEGPFLGRAFVDANFAFFSTAIRGTPENEVRWRRGVRLVEDSIGEGVGRLYVATYFPPESKARMDALVKNLLAAYRTSIEQLDWMSPETRREAQAKLATFMPKIGYPVRWRDYSTLVVDRDLVGNVERARVFEYERNLDKLGRPIDRGEWGMTPQTVNAYYNPELNEIVFPAAILHPPFFDPKADDAANYGAIGAVIGHEISHGFDDWGSQYDERGNLRDWWTDEDRRRYVEKTKALVAQYASYSPVPGYRINGELTLGENIADNSGLAIAYKAYRLSLGGREAPVIDGLTGDQRFYMGYVQVWQQKTREAALIAQIKADPHSAGEFRANGALRNQPAFYDAFGVKPGDGMYVPPDQRVIIW